MALTQLQKNIRRYAELHAVYKDAEKELGLLKDFFRAESKGLDTAFHYGKDEVIVTSKSRTGWDTEALVKLAGKKADGCKKTTTYLEVSCRKAAAADAS